MKTRVMATVAAMLGAVAMIGAGGLVTSSALADDATPAAGGGSITITAPSRVDGDNMLAPTVNGQTFTAYELGAYSNVQTANGQITGFNLTPANGISDAEVRNWITAVAVTNGTVDSDYAKVLTYNTTTKTVEFTGTAENLTPLQFVAKYFYGTAADRYGNQNASNTEMRLFAQAAAKSKLLSNGVPATGADDEVQFTNLPEGLYLIVQDSPASTSQTLARAMVTGTTYTSGSTTYTDVHSATNGDFTIGSLFLKAEKVIVTKTTPTDQLVTVGSQREFTITTHVPMYSDYANWTNQTFSISDAPSAALTVDTGTIAVKAGADTLMSDNYTLTTGTPANGFTVTLKNPLALSGKTITVTYTATVNSVTTNAITNTATVDFSNDPSSISSHGEATTETPTELYVASAPLQKVKFGTERPLQGAVFAVTSNNNPVKFDYDANSQTYSVNAKGAVTELTISSDSGINIAGLAADSGKAVTYTFTETKAPAGYVLGQNPVSFTLTVTPTFTDGKLTSVSFDINSTTFANFIDEYDAAVRNSTPIATTSLDQTVDGKTVTVTKFTSGLIRVENTTNPSDFAKTGGEITRVLVIVAVLAVIGGAFLIAAHVRRNRMKV